MNLYNISNKEKGKKNLWYLSLLMKIQVSTM